MVDERVFTPDGLGFYFWHDNELFGPFATRAFAQKTASSVLPERKLVTLHPEAQQDFGDAGWRPGSCGGFRMFEDDDAAPKEETP